MCECFLGENIPGRITQPFPIYERESFRMHVCALDSVTPTYENFCWIDAIYDLIIKMKIGM